MRNRYIIARYQENLEWTKALDEEIIIYSSGDSKTALRHSEENSLRTKYIGSNIFFRYKNEEQAFDYNPTAKLIFFPNEGREAGKWLEYLVTYYGKYADRNIFLQAYPFDHVSLKEIRSISGDYGYIKGANLDNNFEDDRWKHNPHGQDQSAVYQEIYGNFIPERFYWRVGAQFYITKELLMKNKQSYYELLQDVIREFEEDGPYCFERSWLTFILHSPAAYRVDGGLEPEIEAVPPEDGIQ